MLTASRYLIHLIDDESKIRRLLARSLEIEGFDVVASDSGKQALQTIKKQVQKPDLIILDYMMPEMDGLMFLQELRKTESIPVIMLSAVGEVSKKAKALELGADDYVVKPFSVEEMIARIHAVLRRTQGRSGKAAEKWIENGPLRMQPDKRICEYKGEAIKFADTEYRLLQVLVERAGRVVMHEDLLRQVWGAQYIGELNYLRVSLSRIRKKLTEAGLDGGVISSYSGIGYYIEELENEDL